MKIEIEHYYYTVAFQPTPKPKDNSKLPKFMIRSINKL